MSENTEQSGEYAAYQSFLLRLWRVKEAEQGWRASLESAQTGERRGFASLEALFDYVRWQTRGGLGPGAVGDGDGTD